MFSRPAEWLLVKVLAAMTDSLSEPQGTTRWTQGIISKLFSDLHMSYVERVCPAQPHTNKLTFK